MRTATYRKLSKVVVIEENCVQNHDHLIRTLSIIIRIVVFPVAVSDPSPNNGDNYGNEDDR